VAKILIVVANMDVGGVRTHIRALTKYITAHEWSILDLSQYGRFERYIAVWRMAKGFDIINNHGTGVGLVVGKLRGKRTVETVHNVYSHLTWIHRLHYRLCLKFADVVCTYCEEIKRYSEQTFGAKDVVLFPHCVELVDEAKRRRHGPICAVGRLVEQRRFAEIIDTYRIYGDGRPLVVVGGGPLRSQLISHSLGSNVLFTGPCSNPIPIIAECALAVVLTDKAAGIPLAALESMSLGVPTVTVLAEFVEALRILRTRPTVLRHLGDYQREYVRRAHNPERFALTTQRIYEGV
jgi:glycosyltransferase involved in cell wall biosynthesis